MKRTAFLAVCVLVAGCNQGSDPTRTASTTPPAAGTTSGPNAGDAEAAGSAGRASAAQDAAAGRPPPNPALAALPLAQRFDCLRENKATVVAAHRGGPTRDFPENAIETFERTLKAATPVLEVDVAQSRDGVLFLMHDESLERTSTGEGLISELSWAEIETARLETYSSETTFAPPTLDAALAWAKANNAVLELDRKQTTPIGALVDAVETAKAENNVILITYTDEQAVAAHRRNRELMITATIDSLAKLDQLVARGVNPERLIAWTGTQTPNPELWTALSTRGVETAFGTLGRRGERLDDQYWEDRDGSEYNDLAAGGLNLVATDYSDRVARVMTGDDIAREKCGF
ncbi:glycerophosphodiester phosphodiesterase [bacterium]|nr:glycerophosphodiester phosphodiesterase [bacterium]